MRRLPKVVALVSVAMFLVCAGFVISNASETCNGKTGDTWTECGEFRDCDGDFATCEEGTSVKQIKSFEACKDGASNEYCIEEDTDCTKTLFCKYSLELFICVPDEENPLLDSEGKPVVSTEVRGVVKSCSTSS